MTEPYLPYPVNWRKSTLKPSKEAEVITSVCSGGTPSTKIEKYWNGEIPWLTPKEICNGKNNIFVSKTERNISETGLENSGAKIFPLGIVMLTKRAPVGEVAVNAVPMSTNQGFLNFSCGRELDPLFLYFWFKANKSYLNKVANGSTYKELYIGDLFELVIAYPPLVEQKRIVSFLLTLKLVASLGKAIESIKMNEAEINSVQKDNRFLEDIQKKILLNIMSGRINIKQVMSNAK